MENNMKTSDMKKSFFQLTKFAHNCNIIVILLISIFFLLLPFISIISAIHDDGLNGEGIPKFAFRVHRKLSPDIEKWANERVESGKSKEMNIEDISGTEWPLFGSVFYLLATESLQEAWEKDNSFSKVAPNVYSKGAIESATKLVTDPNHASWVKLHWGKDYLSRENVFYRMLLINAMVSYEKLLGDQKYRGFLRDQVETLSAELDKSTYGVLDDYPGQCYPTDVTTAIAAIKRADSLLKTDHSEFVKRSIRGFEGDMLDSTGLPPYSADSDSGSIGISRGCSSQWFVVWVPMLWPEKAEQYYKNYEEHFWQEKWGAYGFREFRKGQSSEYDWYYDVDSGPVLEGFGMSASAFGISAARTNGRFDHAYPMSTELIAISVPLINGTLLLPRLLSNATDAPYLGESCVLYNLTRMPGKEVDIIKGGRLPGFVICMLGLYMGTFLLVLFAIVLMLKRKINDKVAPFEKIQFVIWIILLVVGVVFFFNNNLPMGVVFILFSQLLPRLRNVRTKTLTPQHTA